MPHDVWRPATQVKLRGFRVELGEVEAALTALPGVALAVALVLRDPAGAQRLVAYVTPAAAPPAELAAGLKGRLPTHMVPSVIVPLEAMPLLPNEKIDRKVLPCLGSLVAKPVACSANAANSKMRVLAGMLALCGALLRAPSPVRHLSDYSEGLLASISLLS